MGLPTLTGTATRARICRSNKKGSSGVPQNPEVHVGVIGTGVMEGHHTRIAAMLPGCSLIGLQAVQIAESIQASIGAPLTTV